MHSIVSHKILVVKNLEFGKILQYQLAEKIVVDYSYYISVCVIRPCKRFFLFPLAIGTQKKQALLLLTLFYNNVGTCKYAYTYVKVKHNIGDF